ncbi:MAG TPA: ABC transporter ATP-binding protein [Stellaceae bacterium]|nr:ABC transporter ATP-binding protein [Stellaceae bacterium]
MSEAAAQPFVRLEGVAKRFGATAAVDDVSLSIERGAFFALLGPSGCGKTTLLRMLAGFEVPDRGRILIDGADVAGVPPYARPTNMMFQSYALFPHMSAAENVGFGLRQERLPRAAIDARVAAMLDLVQLRHLAQRRPHQLSGGERQRVALARALAKEPKLLLLDEPLAALDRKLREETRLELVRIQHRVGITFLVVTHDQEEAMGMASRMAVMSKGHVVQVGTPADIYERPSCRFVADFIGGVNLFEGRVVETRADGVAIDCAELDQRLVVAGGGVAIGSTVAIAVRPERIELSAAPSALPNRLAGRVADISYRGEASSVNVALATGRLVRVTLPNVGRTDEPRLAPGIAVWLGWAPEAGVLLTS